MKNIFKEYISYVLIIVAVILVRTFIVTPVRVNGRSMVDTLLEGDIMILNKLGDIKRESIVVVDKAVDGSRLIKRVIGLPGESIKCVDGDIYINDEVYDDKYAYGITLDFDTVELQDDEYFVMGDNRVVSEDSRYFGPVKEKYLLGTTRLILFPFKRIGIVK